MFTHMVLVKRVAHTARGAQYELLVYRVEETGEYRIFIAKGGFGVGDVYTAAQEVVDDARSAQGVDIVEALISTAIADIDRDEFGKY